MASAALAVYPLIAEARQRQRRRHALLLFLLGAVIAAAGIAAAPRDRGATSSGTAAPRQPSIASQVNDIVTRFNTALVSGQYTQACALIDPLTGISALEGETDSVGIHGSCEARLAGAAHLLGRTFVNDLAPAWSFSYAQNGVRYAGSRAHGFIAVASFFLPNRPTPAVYHLRPVRLPDQATIFWVTVQQRSPHAPALLACPPLLCGGAYGAHTTFLSRYLRYKSTLAHR